MSLPAGSRIDRYEVLELLGAGGMGEVYRALDPKLERQVALKILRVATTVGTDGAARIFREARAAAALSHPNVVAVYDVGEVHEPEELRGLAYIAMELVIGRTLRASIGDTALSMGRRSACLLDVARALAAAHAAEIVHRDVKPENVMIRSDGVVKVLDFGIARRAPSIDRMASTLGQGTPATERDKIEQNFATLTEPGRVVGTPFYMAPEQLRGEKLDGRADQFAWGVIAYELVTGATPWRRDADPLMTVSEILSADPPAPDAVDPRVPPRLSAAIRRALSKRREARFPSMDALIGTVTADDRAPGGDGPTQRSASESVRGETESLETEAPPGRRPSAFAWAFLGVATLIASALTVTGLVVRARHRGAATATPPLRIAAQDDCTSSAACSREHGGEAWRCHSTRRVCVPIASVDCKAYAEPGDLESEDTVWFGGMYPLDEAHDFASELRAVDLARKDFAQAIGSDAARHDALRARPIALAICSESSDPLRAARHLAEDVESPAVIGFRSAKRALLSIPGVFLPAHILSFISISQVADLTRIPAPPDEPRMVWRSTIKADDQVPALSSFISEVVGPQVRAQGSRAPLRVATVRPPRIEHDGTDAFLHALRINGRSALEDGDNFRQFVLDTRDPVAADRVLSALADFQPNVVMPGGLQEFVPAVVAPLEKKWRSGARPFYFVGSEFEPSTLAFIDRDISRRRRFWSVTNVSGTVTNAQFVLHYNQAFPDDPVMLTNAPQPSYDAFYTLAYATYSLGDGRVTGPGLSQAISQLLPPAATVDVGPAGIFDAFQTLRSHRGIDLNGAIGSLDFDLRTGEAPISYAILCCGVDGSGAASGSVESGLVYDPRKGRLVGSLKCP